MVSLSKERSNQLVFMLNRLYTINRSFTQPVSNFILSSWEAANLELKREYKDDSTHLQNYNATEADKETVSSYWEQTQ